MALPGQAAPVRRKRLRSRRGWRPRLSVPGRSVWARRMSHPDASAPADGRPIESGEVWENPVTSERAVDLELPWQNGEGRGVAELTALPGARVMGEHLHPALHERFSVLQGELTVVRDGRRSVLGVGESAQIEPGVWHDWWNDAQAHAVVRVEFTPGERFVHMLETMFGLASEGHVNVKGMPNPLQLALTAQEFSDVIVFRKPPRAVQRVQRADADRQTARLSRHLPEPLAHNARTPITAPYVSLTIQIGPLLSWCARSALLCANSTSTTRGHGL
jgi:quercetin dioxygenase-like cupin family protein